MKSVRTLAVAVLAAVLVLSVVGCGQQDVAAKVNGDVITNAEMQKQVDELKKQYPQMFEGADAEGRLLDFKQRILDNLINQKLLEQAAEEKGIKVDDAAIKTQIEQLKAGFKDDAQFKSALQSAGMNEESLKAQVKEQLLTQKIVESLAKGTTPTPAQIKAYYDSNKTQFFQKEAKRASHILFKPEDKAKAAAVLKQIKAGGDFAALAKSNSVDTATASKGGDLGWPSTPYVAEFETALAKLDKGELSALVETPYGWHIIKVTDERKSSQKKLEDVKDQISQILTQQVRADAYQKYLDALRKKAKIEILVEELKLPAASKATTGTP